MLKAIDREHWSKKPPASILTIDIERLPGLAWRFDQKGSAFTHWSQFEQAPRTICWAARWMGQSRMHFEAEWKNPERLITRSWELFDAADIVVTYNGDRFDIKHLRAEWAKADLPPPRPWKSVDLYKQSKQFGMLSYSMDYLAQFLGLTGKQGAYSIPLARDAVNGNKQAQKAMRDYNVADVEVTEALYWRLLPWISNHPHMGSSTELTCNRCGGKQLDELPSRYRAVVLTYTQYRCRQCAGIVRANFHATRTAATTGVRT